MLKDANHRGFTIIEVVITIAIGAAVMALVLNAVQGARRSQRNTNRSADVSAIAGAVNQYNANRNRLPTSQTELDPYIDELAHYAWSTTPTSSGIKIEAMTAAIAGADWNTAAASTVEDVAENDGRDLATILTAAECVAGDHTFTGTDDVNNLAAEGSTRQVVVLYRLEGDDATFCEEI